MFDTLKKGIVKFGGGVRGVLSPIYARVVTPIVTGSQSAIEAFMNRVRPNKPQLNSPSASETVQEAGIFRKGYAVFKTALGKINFRRKADTITTETHASADSPQIAKPDELGISAQSNEPNSHKEAQPDELSNYKESLPDELNSYKEALPDEEGFYDPLDYDDEDDEDDDDDQEAGSSINPTTSTNDAVQNFIEEPALSPDETAKKIEAQEEKGEEAVPKAEQGVAPAPTPTPYDQEPTERVKTIVDLVKHSNLAAARLLITPESKYNSTFTQEEKAEIDLAIAELLKQNSLSLLRGISYTSSYIAQEIDRIIAETVPSHLRNVLSIPSAPSWLIPWLPVDTTGIFLLSAGSQIRSAIDITGLWSIYTAAKLPFVAAHFLSEASITILENPDNPTQAIMMRAADIAEGYIERTATLVTDHAESLNVRLNG